MTLTTILLFAADAAATSWGPTPTNLVDRIAAADVVGEFLVVSTATVLVDGKIPVTHALLRPTVKVRGDVADITLILPGGIQNGRFHRVIPDGFQVSAGVDYVGLTIERSDSSTGKNLMLGRFTADANNDADEKWDNATAAWTVCDDVVTSPNGPDQIYALIHGTSCQDPVIKWWLSADLTCSWGAPDYLVGTRTPHLCSGTPYLVHPDPYDFRGVPAGTYYLCAFIDPGDLITESHAGDSDNDAKSEVQVTVNDCP